jgi:hypothetical protein
MKSKFRKESVQLKFVLGTDNQNFNTLKDELSNNLILEYVRKNKKISIRASDGTSGCALSGSPVMSQKIQVNIH